MAPHRLHLRARAATIVNACIVGKCPFDHRFGCRTVMATHWRLSEIQKKKEKADE